MSLAAPRRVLRSVVLLSLSFAVASPALALARKGLRAWKPAVRTATASKAPTTSPDPTSGASGAPNQRGKVVLFPFQNDDDDVSKHVARLLSARGLEVVTGVRPVDSPEQYREMASHLMLVGYVDGSVREKGAKAKVTVRLRSGYSGRIVAQPTFVESRGNLRHEIAEKLWKKVGPAVARVCKDASKPRKRSRTTLTIDAGTPIETTPRQPPAESQAATAAAAAAPATATPKSKSPATSATTWVDPFAE